MERKLKKQIVDAAEAVKRKVRKMRDIESDNQNTVESVLQPIIKPLEKIAGGKDNFNLKNGEINNIDNVNNSFVNKTLSNKSNDQIHFKDISDKSNLEESENENNESDYDTEYESFHTNDSKNDDDHENDVSSWSLSSETYKDVPFGIRLERGKPMLGSSRVRLTGDTIIVAGREFTLTSGLQELLFKKVPETGLVSKEDISNYKLMLLDTNAHRRDFNPLKPIKSNKGRKYLEIIKPLFKFERSNSTNTNDSQAIGKGLPLMKKYHNNTDYVYWDDPNELVERLKLLVASRQAGNDGAINNEIISIVEELRERGVLPKLYKERL